MWCNDGEQQESTGEPSDTDSSAIIGIVIGIVVILVVIGAAVYVYTRGNGGDAQTTSFENPMYDHSGSAATSSGDGVDAMYAQVDQGVSTAPAHSNSGYMDVQGGASSAQTQSAGYMDVQPTPGFVDDVDNGEEDV